MGAKTQTVVGLVLISKLALAGLALAAPMAVAWPDDQSRSDHRDLLAERLVLARQESAAPAAFAPPVPVPLPTSLALIGSSLLVLALVGATL